MTPARRPRGDALSSRRGRLGPRQLAGCAFLLTWTPAASMGQQPQAARWTPPALSTTGYESSPVFTPDGRTMYYVSADESFRSYRILQSDCREDGWSPGTTPEFALAPPVLDADPFVSPGGRQLYFISTRHDPLNEDFDIYRVERRENGSWSSPARLPAPVNSSASELLPRQDASGRLYFGSARPGGFGQGDIYVATEEPAGDWSVENVGPPVSTAANEYEAEVSHDGDALVVVADRGDRSHLYRFHRGEEGWREVGRVPASPDVFQVGPLLSPAGDRLLFAQAITGLSGEFFVTDLEPSPAGSWPPACD